jgi:large subunit ribosomal protein L18
MNSLEIRKNRVKNKIQAASSRPRLKVFRSNKEIYAQIIEDRTGKILASASSLKEKSAKSKTESAKNVGKKIAEIAKKNKVSEVVFDRGSYNYHGRVAALAQGAREAGLIF